MGALSTYLTSVQRLLHDSTYRFWSQAELTDYINQGRSQVALDSKCLQQLVTGISLVAGTETYSMAALAVPTNYTPVDVMGITIYWGNLRAKLYRFGWDRFDAGLRSLQNYKQTPVAYCRLGSNTVYIGPIPDQNYTSDWRIALAPPALASDSDPEPLPIPFTDPVAYYAAHKAKFQSQDLGEADIFEQYYRKRMMSAARQYSAAVVPNAYAL